MLRPPQGVRVGGVKLSGRSSSGRIRGPTQYDPSAASVKRDASTSPPDRRAPSWRPSPATPRTATRRRSRWESPRRRSFAPRAYVARQRAKDLPSQPVSLAGEDRYARYREAFRRHHLPCAFVDVELFLRNVRDVAARSAGKPIRVASKSVRSVGLLRRVFEADPAYRGVMALSAAEAGYLAGQGVDDVLVAHPRTGATAVAPVGRAAG